MESRECFEARILPKKAAFRPSFTSRMYSEPLVRRIEDARLREEAPSRPPTMDAFQSSSLTTFILPCTKL